VGHRLGIRVPEIRAVELTTTQLHVFNAGALETESVLVASRLIEPAEALTPSSTNEVDGADLAGIYVFDTLVWNTDRKEEHVLAQKREDGWDLFSIDHANALSVGDTLAGALDPQQLAPPPMTLIRPLIGMADLEPWVERAQEISRPEFARMVHSLPSWWVVEPDAADTLADALYARAKALKSAISPHFA
jgi:hypothetical protein